MASLILRAVARAASSAAWAASRCAAAASAARSGSGGAAASDPLMRASSVAAATTVRSPASSGSVHPPIAARLSGGSGSSIATSPPSPNVFDPNFLNSVRVLFEADEKDLESDEALRALYERWCKFYNEKRDRDEMARRFSYFKQTVMEVEENKKSDLPYRIGINLFADGKLDEMCGGATHSLMSLPYSKSPVYARQSDFLFKEDPKELGQATSATEASKELGQATSATEASNPSA